MTKKEKIAFSWKSLDYPLVLCPPMDGITDYAYRKLITEMGGSDAIYCEFVNVQALIYGNIKTLKELKYDNLQRPIIIQLFGSDPKHFYEASQIAVKLGFDGIDINMGCPAHKVAAKGSGCALMNNPNNAIKIVEKAIEGANKMWRKLGGVGKYEVTTKMRLGVDNIDTVLEYAPALVEAGSKMVAVHGRTLKQMYTGNADWNQIKAVKDILNFNEIPVIGSGDVQTPYQALYNLITYNVDGIMIGRGSFGNPWIFRKDISRKIKKLYYAVKSGDISLEECEAQLASWQPSTMKEVCDMAYKHAKYMYEDKGDTGIIQMRKHLAWYFTGFHDASKYRSKLVLVNTLEDIEKVFDELTSHYSTF